MRTLIALVMGFAIAALTIPVLASSAPTRSFDAVSLLQRRVANLETKMRAVTAILKSQAKINNLQQRIDSTTNDRLASLDNRISGLESAPPPPTPTATVNSYLGAPVLISPYTWGYASASCLNGGTLIAGGFDTNYPVDLGNSKPNGTLWDIAAWNPYGGDTAVVTPYAVCLTLGS